MGKKGGEMGLMQLIPDIMRRFRRNASAGPDTILEIHNLTPLTVGIVPVRLSPIRLPVSLILIQSTIANAGFIYVGGAEVNVLNGIELDGGRGVLFSTGAGGLSTQQLMLGGLGFGILSRIEDVSSPQAQQAIDSVIGPGGRTENRHTVLYLNNIWVVASAAGQTLRGIYILPLRVDQ
jgi:hypothetical protein